LSSLSTKYILSVWLLFLIHSIAPAQDPHFSQFYSAPLYTNPALAGTTAQGRFLFNYRAQWTQLPGEFVTYQLSYDQPIYQTSSSFGFSMVLDKAGSAGVRSTNLQAVYAYNLKLSEIASLKAGLQLGYGNRNLDYFKLVFGDQLSETGYIGSPSAEQGLPNETINFIEAGAGLALYTDNFWLGISGFHLNQPNHSITETKENLPMRISVQTGFKITRYKSTKNKREGYDMALTPGIYYSQQGKFRQLDIGANGFIDPLILGLWYRGLPIQRNAFGALVSSVGFKYQGITFLYSFDAGISKIARNAGGAHEFSLNLRVGDRETKKKYRRRKGEAVFPSWVY
jgi:type IX secretion system PorP/SprF family membrane protein